MSPSPAAPASPAHRGFSAAPAAWVAGGFCGGILAGAASPEGEVLAILLALACGAFASLRLRRGAGGFSSRAAAVLFAAAVGFAEGRVRIALPASEAERAFAELGLARGGGEVASDRRDRVEGVLQDFWTGTPPRAHGRMRAERIWDGRARAWREFRADVYVFVSGDSPVIPVGDRGDRVVAVGRLRREDLPASDRDVALPWPEYRMSVKSAQRLESRRPTALSFLTAGNRWLFSRLRPPVAGGAAGAAGPADAAFDRDVRGPLAALLLGRTSELDRGMVARYRRGGLYHLLVISGLHVALAAGLVLLLLRALSVRGRPRDALLLSAVVIFVVTGGANPPAVRAGIGFAILLGSRLLERPVGAAQAIGLSAIVLFGAEPTQLYAVGTLLTFAAVCGIAAFTAPIRSRLPARPELLFGGLAAATAAQIGTAPILLWRFNVVSAGAWLTAPAAIPISSALIAVGSALLLCLALSVPAGALVSLFGAGSRALEWIAGRATGMSLLRPTPPLPAVVAVTVLLAAGLALGRRARGIPRKVAYALAASLFAVLALRGGPSGPARGFRIEALDVGQGDALLLRWNRHAFLVDGGGPFDLDARDFGRTRLLPKLLDRGVTRLDAILVTHPHPDHALGVFALLDEIEVGALWRSAGEDEADLYRDLEAAAAARRIPVRALRPRETARWRDASLRVLRSGGPRTKKDATNNQSVVAIFERDGRRAMLTGDAGAAAEGELLARGLDLSADVLKVGHHGSRGGSTPAFLAAVRPRAALISCGRENRFGHPAPQTLEALSAAGIRVFRTDSDSDILVELSPDGTRLRKRNLR